MNQFEDRTRRSTDRGLIGATKTAERIGIWIILFGALVGVGAFGRQIRELIENYPSLEIRTTSIEKALAVEDDRWKRVENWMNRLDAKLENQNRRNRQDE